ncbi:GOLPH3/VPS74 family protein [Pseudidiomarina terrestris]|nr:MULTISPECIES: GPP34 family phosphoprotein [unclassified Pseudidiomarina]
MTAQESEVDLTTQVARECARQLGYLLQHERAGNGLDQTELAAQVRAIVYDNKNGKNFMHTGTRTTEQQLKLYEALMLLALCEEKGTMNAAYINYGVAAAILADLLLMKRIEVDAENKDKVRVLDDAPTGDQVFDEALQKMATAKRRGKLKDWVMRVGAIPKLKHKVAQALVADGIVELEEKKVLWLFTKRVYPEVNPAPEQHLRSEMRRLILDRPLEIDPRIAVIVSLAKGARLLPQVFSKDELKSNKERIGQVVNGELLGQTAKDVIAAVEVAVMMAAIMPAIMAASTSAATSGTSSC